MVRTSKRTPPGYCAFRVHPLDFFLNWWVWSDLSSEALLLIPLEVRISDVKRAKAQLARDQVRAVRHYPPWQEVTLRFAAKVLHLSGKSFGERGITNDLFIKGIGR